MTEQITKAGGPNPAGQKPAGHKARKSVRDLLRSLRVDRLEKTYRTPALRRLDQEKAGLEAVIAALERDRATALEAARKKAEEVAAEGGAREAAAEPEEGGARAEAVPFEDEAVPFEDEAVLNEAKERLEAVVSEIAAREPEESIPFVFVKMRSDAKFTIDSGFQLTFQRRLRENAANLVPQRTEALLLSLENAVAFAEADGETSYTMEDAKAELVNALLELEGKTDAWAENIDDDDPELEIPDGYMEERSVPDEVDPDAYIDFNVQTQDHEEHVRDVKRYNITEGRKREIAERRAALARRPPRDLAASLAKREAHQEAENHAILRAQDQYIFEEARLPAPDGKGESHLDFPHAFSSADEVTELRESDDENETDLYTFLAAAHYELQLIQNSGDARRVAESPAFRLP